MSDDKFPYKECKDCEYYCNSEDLLGIHYECCGRDITKIDTQRCLHKEDRE